MAVGRRWTEVAGIEEGVWRWMACGGGAACHGGRMRRHEEGNGSRGRQGSLSAHQSAARAAGGPGNRWRGGAARTPAMMEVEDDRED